MRAPRPSGLDRRWHWLSVALITVGALVLLAAVLGRTPWVRGDAGLAPPPGAVPTAQQASAGVPLVRLAVAGDVGTGDDQARATAAAMTSQGGPRGWDGLLLLGDNIYPDGSAARADAAVLTPFRDVLRPGTALVAALGNHDEDFGNGPAQLAALGQPGPWFARRFGPLQVIVLDSNRPEDPAQLAFLESTLRTTRARWTVVTMHHPMYSAGYHGSSLAVRSAFGPLLQRYRVPLVLAGHDHDYQRSRLIGATTFLVSGAAAKLRPAGRNVDTVVSTATRHFLDLSVYPQQLVVRAVDQQGRVFDGLVLR